MLDVAIIGAGAAGLGAAKAAAERGLSFRLLEAASFVGGRARTNTTRLGVPFDLGCRSLYGGSDNPFLEFARETGSRLGPSPGNTAFHDGLQFLNAEQTRAGLTAFEQFDSDLSDAHEKWCSDSSPPDRCQADAIDPSHPFARYFLQSLQVEHAAAAADVSIADPVHRLGGEGEEVLDGYGALILRAAGDVPVSLDCPVAAIDLSGPHVALETPKGRIDCRTVVLTVSTAVLAAERIALRPSGWPNRKLAAIEAVPTGSNTKIGFRLKPGALSALPSRGSGDEPCASHVFALRKAILGSLWLGLTSSVGFAGVPQDTTYTGRLLDSGGAPMTGAVNIQLRIYESPFPLTPETPLYTEDHYGVAADRKFKGPFWVR